MKWVGPQAEGDAEQVCAMASSLVGDGMPGAKRSWADAQQGFATPQTSQKDTCPSGWDEIGRFAHPASCMGLQPMLRGLGAQLIPIASQRGLK